LPECEPEACPSRLLLRILERNASPKDQPGSRTPGCKSGGFRVYIVYRHAEHRTILVDKEKPRKAGADAHN
jgi:hypothetical protein